VGLRGGEEISLIRRGDFLRVALVVVGLAGVAAAQSGGSGAQPRSIVTNPVRDEATPFNFGALVQGGFGVTEDRGGFGFLMAGVRAGKVLTATAGKGLLRGNFEYGMELFPLWQSYTPTQVRQNCVYVPEFGRQGGLVRRVYGGRNVYGGELYADHSALELCGQGKTGAVGAGRGRAVVDEPQVSGVRRAAGERRRDQLTSQSGDNGPNDDTSVWNFTPQFGVGAHYFVQPHRSIDLGANAIHISSASLGDKNPGINASVQFTLGYSWWK
jgi:lipid A 3-O-deacylase